MSHYNRVHVKLSNSQLNNKLKSGIKNSVEATSINVIGYSNGEAYFPQKLLFDRQVSGLCKAFPNNSSANMQLLKTQMSKIVQSRFLGRLLELLQKTGLPLMKNILKPLDKKSVLIPLGLTAAASAL